MKDGIAPWNSGDWLLCSLGPGLVPIDVVMFRRFNTEFHIGIFMGLSLDICVYVCSHQATVHFTLAFTYHSAEGPTEDTVTMDTDTGRGPEKGILGQRMDESHPHTVRETSLNID